MSDQGLKKLSPESDAAPRPLTVEQVLDQHFDWLSRMCLFTVRDPAAAEDCLQEVLKEIAKSYRTFAGGSKVTTWMFTVAKRTIGRFQKKSWRYRKMHPLGQDHDAANDQIAPAAETARFDPGELERALSELSEKQRQAVLLHYIEDLSVEQGAARMGCSVSSFKTHLLRARQKLKQLIGKPEQLN